MRKLYFILFFLIFIQSSYAQLDGPFEEYFDNGQLKTQGQYENKKFAGEWKEYHPNGQLSGVYSYTDGKLNKEKIYYFDNGNIRSETKEVSKEYITSGYYESGTLFYQRILNSGFYKEYSENGALLIESNYVDGELSGVWKKYYETGELEWTVHYKEGYRDGAYHNYYKNGQLKLEGKLRKDKKNGEEKRYLENGQLEWTGKYKSDRFDKIWERYDASENVLQKIKFDNGLKRSRDSVVNLLSSRVPEGLIEIVPLYPGCEGSFSNNERRKCLSAKISHFISSRFNVNAPPGRGLEGRHRIMVTFKISKEGTVMGIRAKTEHPILEQEAIQVINLLPKMQPGKQRGKPVVVPYALPVVFNIPEKKSNIRKKQY